MRRSSSSSYSWSTAFQKVLRRRSSEWKGKQPALDDKFKISEHKDGIYKYNQEMLMLQLEKKPTQQMPPIGTSSLPYTIVSSEWHCFAAREQLLDNPHRGAAAEKFGSVLSVFPKVYNIGKILGWELRIHFHSYKRHVTSRRNTFSELQDGFEQWWASWGSVATSWGSAGGGSEAEASGSLTGVCPG
ncbi:hypothetical protein GB937_010568 [Aspergillus fischeri]|nr:hypothetical protein GB937_010568 [Aspergillus fischeri]